MRNESLQLSARDKVVKKMSRDGAVEQNVSSGTEQRISDRILDADFEAKPITNMELGGRARNPDKVRSQNQSRLYGMKKSREEQRLDSLLSNVMGDDSKSKDDMPASMSEHESYTNREETDTYMNIETNTKAGEGVSDGKILSEHRSALVSERGYGYQTKESLADASALKTKKGRRLQERRVLDNFQEGEGQAEDTGKPHLSDSVNATDGMPDKKIRKKKQVLQFDDEPFDVKEKNTKGHKAKSSISPAAYEVANGVGNAVKASAQASDVSDEDTSDALATDAASAGKGMASRALLYEKKMGSRLNFKAEIEGASESPLSMERQTVKEAKAKGKAETATDMAKKSKNKHIQKARLKKEYASAYKNAKSGKTTGEASAKALKGTAKKVKEKAIDVVSKHPGVIAVLAVLLAFVFLFTSVAGTAGALASELGGAVTESTYLSSDNDILAANTAYEEMEKELQEQVDNIERTYPGYDEYRYQVDEITHDPYALTSYLTAMYGNYKAADLSEDLLALFREQFHLELTEEVEIRTRTVTNDDGTTSEEEYEVTILNVKVTNKGLDAIANEHLGENQKKLYAIYQAGLGNRSYLFGDSITIGNPAEGGMGYEIPSEALNDEQFANMIAEAEKYLGYPYVWGGSNPSSSFDCSGFVSYVINNCGNGWNVGRQTANGLRSQCSYVSASDAKPGDLIFFQGTYNTSGASHVGIYVGNGMMIHCGNPIQYTSINSNYWQQHFLAFGRL